MAATLLYPAMNGNQALFPLFTKPNGSTETNLSAPIDDSLSDTHGLDGTRDESSRPSKISKPHKARRQQAPRQKTLQEIVNPTAGRNGSEGGADDLRGYHEQETHDDSPRRSKRRRISEFESVQVGTQLDRSNGMTVQAVRQGSPEVVIPVSSSPLPEPHRAAQSSKDVKTPPKKMLRLKAGGRFSSPISKKSKDEEPSMEVAKKRGRPRKLKDTEQERRLVATVKYDPKTEVGTTISRILAGEERFKKKVKIVAKRQDTSLKTKQSAHPFFNLDRRKEQTRPPTEPSPRKASAATPGKLRRQHLSAEASAAEINETWTSTLLKDRLMFRHPGAKEPAWPDREQAHVRGLLAVERERYAKRELSALRRRKRKAVKRPLADNDSILWHEARSLQPEKDGKIRADGFREPHPSLHLPSRLLMTGNEVRESVASQLSVALADSDADELSSAWPSQRSIHPALLSIYRKVSQSLATTNEAKGETAWTQRYAPSSTDQVLQPKRQTSVLKDWLSSLRVTAVENVVKPAIKPNSTKEPETKKRKRRQKNDGLDDFLVDSDEELHDMDELTYPDETPTSSQGQRILNSIVQVATNGAKLSNAVLLSGPHGCGKTAAAYAAAKELGYKVFEISSSERRSGRDVLDKVGDMTENHLVKHHGTDSSGELSSTEEPNARLDDAFQRDLASGRQGKMASFFKPQVKPKPKAKTSPKEAVKKRAAEAVQNALKKPPPKDQKQSLILLEEVDILFKEDKDFWTTVLKLIATSRRPFIMTCNDEDLVPMQAMSLHAILRFTPPPMDLGTDYLLLIAAAEGHLLRREAVSTLYRSKGCDLRAAMSELDAWCQIGVGDPRGGLSWIYQRYPPGSDLDAQGRQLRIASEDTYHEGMGALAHYSTSANERLQSAWREHGIQASSALGWDALRPTELTIGLKDYCKFANEISAAEVYARMQCSPSLDMTLKPISDKARSHYIDGLRLLQTDESADYSELSSDILASSTLLTFRVHNVLSNDEVEARSRAAGSCMDDTQDRATLARQAFSCFDAIAVPVEPALSSHSGHGLQQSAFDGPLEHIATDIAPYVRSIVQFDLALADQREALGGGNGTKRARTTRAARSALEGGQRGSTRRERWFPKELDLQAVLSTGGREWPKCLAIGPVCADVGGVQSEDGDGPASRGESAT